MLTSAASTSASSSATSITSVASSISSLSAASTSVLVTGIVIASGLVAVLLFLTLLARELVLASDQEIDAALRPIDAVAIPLTVAFALNVVVEAVVALA
jgi:hypothetical protein